MCTTSITASLNRTSCKIFITATSALLLLTYVVEWTLAEGAHLRPVDSFYRSLLYAHSLVFRDDCHRGLLKANFVNDGRCRAELLGSVHPSPLELGWKGLYLYVNICTLFEEFWSVHDRGLCRRARESSSPNGFRNFGTLKLISTDSLLCKSGLTCYNSFSFYDN